MSGPNDARCGTQQAVGARSYTVVWPGCSSSTSPVADGERFPRFSASLMVRRANCLTEESQCNVLTQQAITSTRGNGGTAHPNLHLSGWVYGSVDRKGNWAVFDWSHLPHLHSKANAFSRRLPIMPTGTSTGYTWMGWVYLWIDAMVPECVDWSVCCAVTSAAIRARSKAVYGHIRYHLCVTHRGSTCKSLHKRQPDTTASTSSSVAGATLVMGDNGWGRGSTAGWRASKSGTPSCLTLR